jgi:predicted porin
MNKKLIALAVAGACFAPAAMAQTANPVTLYGQLRMDLESVKSDAPAGSTSLSSRTRLVDHPSLFGIKGTEDLGGGLKAIFQLETAFDSDDASGSATTFGTSAAGVFNRNSGVGLQGAWGTIMLGRWDTPMKQAIGATDLWGDVNKADYTAGTMDQGNFSRRDANVVQYWSPNWGGFQLKAMYQADESKGVACTSPANTTCNPRDLGASLTWSKGNLYLAYAYEEHKDQAIAFTAASPLGTSTIVSGAKEEGNTIGVKWGIGNFTLAGHWGEFKKSSGGTTVKDKSYYVGGQYAMGKHEFIVTWQDVEEGARECDVLGVGWRYRFSKRTYTQLTWVDIDNNATGNCNFGAGGALGSPGYDPSGYGIGIFHVF